MTPRERILKAINRELPDRTPTAWWVRAELVRKLAENFDCDASDVAAKLGIEGWGSIGFDVEFPGYKERCNGKLEGDMPYAGSEYIFRSEDVFEDAYGVVRKVGQDRKYVEWVSGPLVNAASPEEIDFPVVGQILDNPNAAAEVQKQKSEGLFVTAGIGNPFKTAWEVRGFENVLTDYLVNREFLETLYDRIYDLYNELTRRAVHAGVDMISMTGDISMQDRMIITPKLWREVDKPRMAYWVSEAKKINPAVHVFIHSDGNYEEIIPDLVEIGFDVLNPIQPECMDPAKIKREWGDKVCLHGTGSIQKTIPFGTVEDVRNEVIHRIENCGYNGGLVLMPSNVIQYDNPIENVIAFFETARDYPLEGVAVSKVMMDDG
ncbi:MAG: hypothetical protein AUJ92_10520 [Armatimonadetes bacterium CG2_30_59_28]|nr:hypothetical protein [Armatimonadota bacterium]OIO94263.1 MAG: hypothetical protein AUJ92_10520 [Armatimonadetes bacterium CG2_30_59_28]PIU63111.1 MAG: hypothetical protein COS85_16720 [Armatimonadetes bacterium CG07_land_8_20_14_0_80_59_28]PIX40349.1 MAG: hypothetical protein COZ56_14960 [Armatimonadetes bacterium CG_4_8_14_3_um_filter_58_9]PIY43653.1 MAG: hypothetical protein COZ05_10430 [Armatimonadetes bacterium CG_4_10_14_3_um_filter_59_10]